MALRVPTLQWLTLGTMNRLIYHHTRRRLAQWSTPPRRFLSMGIVYPSILSKLGFANHYKIRSNMELMIQDLAKRPVPKFWLPFFTQYKQPLTTNQEYILSIKVINLILTYTCKQINLIQMLPYICVLNPKLQIMHQSYLKTLQSLLSLNYPYDMYDTLKMNNILQQFLLDHEDTIYSLSIGLQEINNDNHIDNHSVYNFLNEHLHNRTCMKLIAQHYIQLMNQRNHQNEIGIIHKNIPIAQIIKHNYDFVSDLCNLKYDTLQLPKLNFQNGLEINFTHVPIIIEYVITEILKNSMRATIENNKTKSVYTDNQSIDINIWKNFDSELTIKISDHGGGVSPDIEDKIFNYSYTTANTTKHMITEPNMGHPTTFETETSNMNIADYSQQDTNLKNIAGMGFGLPLCQIYLNLFQSNIHIQSLYGHGTDVYIHLIGPGNDIFR